MTHPKPVCQPQPLTRTACDARSLPQGRPNALWRVLAVLPYLVPLMGSLAFGQDMCVLLCDHRHGCRLGSHTQTRTLYVRYDTFPLISWLINVFGPMLQAYYSNSFTPFFVFFALYLAVVRNEKLPHFMRFNAMQSILLDICIMLGGLIIQYMPFEIAFSTIGGLCNNLVFTTGAASVFYCVFYTLQGKYADIPTVSEAVYIQVR